jgi:hypothetical protein
VFVRVESSSEWAHRGGGGIGLVLVGVRSAFALGIGAGGRMVKVLGCGVGTALGDVTGVEPIRHAVTRS